MIFVKAFEGSKYKVKDCTNEPFVGVTMMTDPQGRIYPGFRNKSSTVMWNIKLYGFRQLARSHLECNNESDWDTRYEKHLIHDHFKIVG